MSGEPTNAGAKRFEHSVHVPGLDPMTVWRALSEGELLKRWFPIDARVRPGVGGAVFLSWGPMCEGEAPIVKREQGEVLGWEESHDGGAVKICAEFHVSADPEKGGTVVRVVQSGFGKGAKWDNMYDSIANGWKYELFSLTHSLTRHNGKERGMFWEPVSANMDAESAFDVLSADGRLVNGQSLRGQAAGERFAFTGPDGAKYSGTVVRTIARRSWVGIVRELDDGLLRIEAERSGESASMPFVSLSIWGEKRARLEELKAAWRGKLESIFDSVNKGTAAGCGGSGR
jgi:uncharacterized protein YndB with AHSA1/START domain